MECLYVPFALAGCSEIKIEGDEARHAKALRLRLGDSVMLSNGTGNMFSSHIIEIEKKYYLAAVDKEYFNYGEPAKRIALALGMLDNRDRLEFALEKAVELGATDFIILNTRYSHKLKISDERLFSKALAAMKQCKRSRLIRIHSAMNIEELIQFSSEFADKILCDENGNAPKKTDITHDVLFSAGPEGGFSKEEVDKFIESDFLLWNLGIRRLRAESAAICALSAVNIFNL